LLADHIEVSKILSTVTKIFQEQGFHDISRVLRVAKHSSEMVHFDNWNGGTECYAIYLDIDSSYYVHIENKLKEIEESIKVKIESFLRGIEGEVISEVVIRPAAKQYIDWSTCNDSISKSQLISNIENMKAIMNSVATGGPKINTINDEYIKLYSSVDETLDKLNIINTNPFSNLWDWYKKWSSGEFPSYKSRRLFIEEMYFELLKLIHSSTENKNIVGQPYEITGWLRVDRSVSEIRRLMLEAKNEEQFQAIGLISRETIISLAQEIYSFEKHGSIDGISPSNTDAKRMLEAFIAVELKGSSDQAYRKYAKSALTLANDLTHRRTASIHEASICVIAVISLVNIIKVITNKSNIKF
jgi:hypothetical protein